MEKYSYEIKMKIVRSYLNGEGGYGYLAKKYNIHAKRNIEAWVHAYKEFSSDGLRCSRQNRLEEHSIQTEDGHIRWEHTRRLLEKTKYFKVCLVKETAMIIL